MIQVIIAVYYIKIQLLQCLKGIFITIVQLIKTNKKFRIQFSINLIVDSIVPFLQKILQQLYKTFNLHMQQRIPNQYKPTFLQSLFSAFIPVPTKRVLSDKKIEKQKKINLSLTDGIKQKSSKKIKINVSFQTKNTPQTNLRSNRNQSEQVTIKRNTKDKNRGLNFHPRKISFQNQHTLKPKIKSQLMLHPSPSQTFRNNDSTEKSRSFLLSLDKKPDQTQTKQSYQKVKISVDETLAKTNISDNSKKGIENPPNYANINIKNDLFSGHLNYEKKINPELSIYKENSFSKVQKKLKSRTQSYQPSEKKRINKQFFNNIEQNRNRMSNNKQNFQQSRRTTLAIKTDPIQHFSHEHLINSVNIQSHENFKVESKRKDHNQQLLQTPKNQLRQFRKNDIQKFPQKFDSMQQLPQIRRKIDNLFEQVQTIQSKNDDSSRRSESDCFSNVIERFDGQQLKYWRNTQRDFIEDQEVWQKNQKKRKSLYANLLSKFQQKNQEQNSGQKTKMDFKKKTIKNKDQNIEASKQNDQSLAYIEDIFINSKFSVSPPSSAESNKLTLNRDSLNFQPRLKSQATNIYSIFQKLSYLGVGRFASVYFCLDSSINFVFAMKQILRFTVKFNKVQEQLQKQIIIQHSCSHPNVVNLYNAWSDEKKYYLALQYGQTTLLKIIESQGKGLQENKCVQYLSQILRGLEYLHNKGIIHRDIKPENIILVNGCCKIGDFGWATNQVGLLYEACGTPCYISPQIQKMENYTQKTDIWSLGILAYQLINGKLSQDYFRSNIFNKKMLKFDNRVSSGYKNLVELLLSEKEEDRPSASQILSLQIFQK